jgi:hypothetical protein
LGFENTGDEKIENKIDELSKKFFKLTIMALINNI